MTYRVRLSLADEANVVNRDASAVLYVTPFARPFEEHLVRNALLGGTFEYDVAKIRARFTANAFGRSISINWYNPLTGHRTETDIIHPELAQQLLN